MTASFTEIARVGISRLVERHFSRHESRQGYLPPVLAYVNSIPLAVLGSRQQTEVATLSQSAPSLDLRGSFQGLPLAG